MSAVIASPYDMTGQLGEHHRMATRTETQTTTQTATRIATQTATRIATQITTRIAKKGHKKSKLCHERTSMPTNNHYATLSPQKAEIRTKRTFKLTTSIPAGLLAAPSISSTTSLSSAAMSFRAVLNQLYQHKRNAERTLSHLVSNKSYPYPSLNTTLPPQEPDSQRPNPDTDSCFADLPTPAPRCPVMFLPWWRPCRLFSNNQ